MRINPQQVTFAAGEVSALLYGRPDYIRYRSGLKRCRGFIPLPEGVATRFPGTEYLGRVRGDGAVRLIGFAFDDDTPADDTYMLEFTPLRMRVWRQGALVMAGSSPYELVTPYDTASLPRLQTVQSADRVYIVDGLQAPQWLSRFDHDNWTIEPTPFVNGPFHAENDAEAVTVQASAATGAITLAGVGNPFEGMVAGGFLRLQAVNQTTVPTWTGNQAASVGQRMAYDGRVYEIMSFDGSGADTGVNPPTHSEGDVLSAIDGPVWRFVHEGYGVVKLTGVTNANVAAGAVVRTLPDGVVSTPTFRWSGPAWGGTRGWPAAIAESDQRLIYGGTPADPRAIWASAIGAPLIFERGIEADDAFSFTIAASRTRQNKIRWIEEGASGLHIGTSAGHSTARPTDSGLSIGPTTTAFLRGGRKGAAATLPQVVDGEPVFIAASRLKLSGLRYGLEDDRVRADEISQNSRHILYPGAAEIAWQEEPWRCLWFRLDDGQLAGMTLYAEQQVFAFHRHDICGGVLMAMAVKPRDDGTGDELWLAVQRTVQGATRVFVERHARIHFEANLDAPDPLDAWHQCAAVKWAGAATATLTGLGHLEGLTVTAWTDCGAQIGVVQGGALALALPATRAITGLCPCDTQVLRTLPVVAQGNDGGQDGKPRRLAGLGIRVLHTVAGLVRMLSADTAGQERLDATVRLERAGADPFAAVTAWTGPREIKPGSAWGDDAEVEIRPAPGAPLTVAGLTPVFAVGAR